MEIPQDLRDQYISRKQDEYVLGLEALKLKNYHFFEVLGHQMKGNATSFGFDPLQALANRFEAAAKVQDPELLHKLLAELKIYLDCNCKRLF
jgi:HPt (histidine-containing phosphotransfer) domain-containing protein